MPRTINHIFLAPGDRIRVFVTGAIQISPADYVTDDINLYFGLDGDPIGPQVELVDRFVAALQQLRTGLLRKAVVDPAPGGLVEAALGDVCEP